jgi:hypothetical protein
MLGRIKAFLGLAIFVAGVYLGWMVIPVYMSNYQLEDSMKTIAKFSSIGNRTDESIRDEVMKEAKKYDVPITPEMVNIVRGDSRIDISAKYTVVLDLVGGKQLTLNFAPSSSGQK